MLHNLRSLIATAWRPVNVSERKLNVTVGPDDLSPPLMRCPLCHEGGERRPAALLQAQPEVRLLLCPHCGGASASRMPTEDFLRRYYQDYFADGGERVSLRGYRRFFAHLRKLKLFEQKRDHWHLLDFGGGDGSLSLAIAARMIDRGMAKRVQVTLVDYHPPARPPREGIELVELANLTMVAPGSQDLALASGVIEHVPDAGEAMQQLARAMKPGAMLYARAPYALPMKRLCASYDLQFPMHLHDISPACWNALARHAGLSVMHSQPSIVKCGPFERPHYWLAASLLKLPAHAQLRLPWLKARTLLWPYVGGWEVVLRRD